LEVNREKETARTASPPIPVGRKLPKKVLRKKIFTTLPRGARMPKASSK
jgi:hypothetical protein